MIGNLLDRLYDWLYTPKADREMRVILHLVIGKEETAHDK